LRSLLGLLDLGGVLLDLPHDSSVLPVDEICIGVVFQLVFDQFVDLHLLDHLFGELLLVHVDSWVSEAEGVAGDLEIGKDPFIGGIVEDHFVVDHLDVFCRDEVVDDEVLQFELFL
jgi:hypothetical protein